MAPSRLWDFLFVYSNYHAEHHYFPSVPFYNLRKLHLRLRPLYAQLGLKPHTYREIVWEWFVRNRAPHTDWDKAGDPDGPGRGPHRGVAEGRLRAGSSSAPRPRRPTRGAASPGGTPDRYGLMSRIGVPSSMSTPRTRRRGPSRPSSSTTERPIGFGRRGERDAKTPCGRLRVERDRRDELVALGAVEHPQDEEVREALDVLRGPASSSGRSSRVPSAWCSAPGPFGISDVSRYGLRTKPIGLIANVAVVVAHEVPPGPDKATIPRATEDRRRHAAPRPDRRRRLRGERRPDLPRRERPLGEPPDREGGDARGLRRRTRGSSGASTPRGGARRSAVRPNPGHARARRGRGDAWATASSS